MVEIRLAFLIGERAGLFVRNRRYVDAIFADGESPLKHARDIGLAAVMIPDLVPRREVRRLRDTDAL